jgi:hypothetical protein
MCILRKKRLHLRVRAVALEVGVVWHARVRARCRGVMRARAASGRVGRIRIHEACRLAADREAGGVIWTLERSRAVGAKIDRAVSHMAALVVVDAHRQVVAVDERYIVVIEAIRRERELGQGGRWNTLCSTSHQKH